MHTFSNVINHTMKLNNFHSTSLNIKTIFMMSDGHTVFKIILLSVKRGFGNETEYL